MSSCASTVQRSIAIWKSYFFLGHVLCLVIGVVCSVLPKPKATKKTA